MHSFFKSIRDLHKFVVNNGFITVLRGARSTADGKEALQLYNIVVSWLHLCFISLWIFCCACVSSTVS